MFTYTKDELKTAKTLAKKFNITKLGSIGTNPKLIKSDKTGEYISYGVTLAPHIQAGKKYNVCPNASPGCSAACLYHGGMGQMSSVQNARIKKTKFYFDHRNEFKILLHNELKAFDKKAKKEDKKGVARLNVMSDIVWEVVFPELFTDFPDIQFNDYTKIIKRFERKLPDNYHLTLSRSETNEKQIQDLLKKKTGITVAVVFANKLPKTYLGLPVVDADKTDLRFLDFPKGQSGIAGLATKGKAKKDTTGFVVDPDAIAPKSLALSVLQ